jgi:large subunit ribosomal protein L29
MKAHEIREKTIDEVREDLEIAEENLRNLSFQVVTHQLEKTSLIKEAKKDIARIKTVIREHELGVNKLVGADTE